MKMLTKILLTLTAAAALSSATPAFANLVNNPGFELTGFTDWTQFGNTGATGVSGSSPTGVGPHGGLQLGWFGAVGSDGGIYQDLTTVALQTYNLTFWLANDPGTPNDWSVLWNGVSIGGAVNAPPFGYTLFSFTVLGTGLDELRFSFRQDPRYFELDDISVTSTSAPDGGNTLWLLGLAMVSICLIRRWAPAVSVR
jgi:hypothetical protein